MSRGFQQNEAGKWVPFDDDFDDDRFHCDLLNDLPMEIWTESDVGQILLQLAMDGRCRYTKLNSTLGRFDPL